MNNLASSSTSHCRVMFKLSDEKWGSRAEFADTITNELVADNPYLKGSEIVRIYHHQSKCIKIIYPESGNHGIRKDEDLFNMQGVDVEIVKV